MRHRYTVIKISDGDTLVATDGNLRFKVRLAGLDTPEQGQPYSKVATHQLSEYVLGKNVEIRPVGKGYDSFGRVLGFVFINGKDIALELIGEGLATYYRPGCKDYPADKKKYDYNPLPYVQAEIKAKRQKKAVWSEPAVLPCKYRQTKRAAAKQIAQDASASQPP